MDRDLKMLMILVVSFILGFPVGLSIGYLFKSFNAAVLGHSVFSLSMAFFLVCWFIGLDNKEEERDS